MKDLPQVRIDERAFHRVSLGYPWIFRSEIINAKESAQTEAGGIVDFVRDKGDFIARGFLNPKTQLMGRVLTRTPSDKIDGKFIQHRLQQCLHYRDNLYGSPFYRLVHAESDGLPGLIIDRYGDVVVVQANTAGMEKMLPQISEALTALIKPRAVILRNDTGAREHEGLAEEVKISSGKLDGFVKITENGVSFNVDVMEGQKTGWFYDQRDNRAWVASLAKDKSVVDVFCHTGGFGVTALAKGAASATFIDSSEKALQQTQKNAELNGVEKKTTVIHDKAFEAMERLRDQAKKFGVVVVDPPAFIKTRKDMNPGMKGYQKLAKLAAPLVEKGGFLFFASCSHHASAQELLEAIVEPLAKTGRTFQLVKTAGAGADHPVHPALPETGYLKALTFRFLD